MVFLDLPEVYVDDSDDPKSEPIDYHNYDWTLQRQRRMNYAWKKLSLEGHTTQKYLN